MDIVKIVGIGLVTAFCALILRESKPEIAMVISLVGGVIILLLTIELLVDIVAVFRTLAEKTGLPNTLFSAIIKIIGVGYVAEFGSGMCEDTGNKSLGDKISFAGKVLILFLSLPIIQSMLEIIVGLLQ